MTKAAIKRSRTIISPKKKRRENLNHDRATISSSKNNKEAYIGLARIFSPPKIGATVNYQESNSVCNISIPKTSNSKRQEKNPNPGSRSLA